MALSALHAGARSWASCALWESLLEVVLET